MDNIPYAYIIVEDSIAHLSDNMTDDIKHAIKSLFMECPDQIYKPGSSNYQYHKC